MEYWQGPARWVNTALLAVLTLFGVHGLLLLVGAQESNVLVGLIARLARALLTPVAGIVPGQGPLVTTVLGAVFAVGTALVVLAVIRGRQERRVAGTGRTTQSSATEAPSRSGQTSPRPGGRTGSDQELRSSLAQRPTGG